MAQGLIHRHPPPAIQATRRLQMAPCARRDAQRVPRQLGVAMGAGAAVMADGTVSAKHSSASELFVRGFRTPAHLTSLSSRRGSLGFAPCSAQPLSASSGRSAQCGGTARRRWCWCWCWCWSIIAPGPLSRSPRLVYRPWEHLVKRPWAGRRDGGREA